MMAGRVCRRKREFMRASMTLESACVLPLFFMAVLTLIMFMDAVRMQAEENLRLSNMARSMSSGAGAAGELIPGDAIWIDLRLTKPFEYPFAVLGLPKLRVAVRARVFPWTGCQDGIAALHGNDSENDSRTVYVTDYESVWHSHSDCTHVNITVLSCSASEIGHMRNAYGRKYRKCPGFPKGYQGTVYFAEKGEYYYPDSDRAGLTRHVRIARAEDVRGLCQCGRCAARDAA